MNILRHITRRIFQTPLEREREFYRRFRGLSDAIEAQPDSLTHYVLRGEMLLERGDLARATADFEMARGLAAKVDRERGWGLLEQALGDRAMQGLELARRQGA